MSPNGDSEHVAAIPLPTGALPDSGAAARSRAKDLPVVEIRGGRGRLSFNTFRELWLYREVLAAFAMRAVKIKYKQAVIGIGWAVLQPVLAAGLFAIFLGRLAEVSSEGAPYLLFALAGMVCWTYFSNAAGTGMSSLVDDAPLLRKIYFPRDVLPLARISAALVDLAPGLGVLFVVGLAYGIVPGPEWIALPIPIFLLVVSASALGMGLSAINVYYRDVRYALPFFLQMGLFACPIAFSVDIIPEPWRTVYTIFNPVAAAIDGVRNIVLHGTWPDLLTTAGAFAWSIALLIPGYMLFKRLERSFADRI